MKKLTILLLIPIFSISCDKEELIKEIKGLNLKTKVPYIDGGVVSQDQNLVFVGYTGVDPGATGIGNIALGGGCNQCYDSLPDIICVDRSNTTGAIKTCIGAVAGNNNIQLSEDANLIFNKEDSTVVVGPIGFVPSLILTSGNNNIPLGEWKGNYQSDSTNYFPISTKEPPGYFEIMKWYWNGFPSTHNGWKVTVKDVAYIHGWTEGMKLDIVLLDCKNCGYLKRYAFDISFTYGFKDEAKLTVTQNKDTTDKYFNIEYPPTPKPTPKPIATISDSLYLSTDKPSSTHEDIPTTLGMEFKPSSAGNITALKFYKVDATAGSYTATLWAMDGSKLFQAIVNVSGTGWKRIPSNVPVNEGQPYIVSVYSTLNQYGYTTGLLSSIRTRNSLSAYAGRYNRGAPGFPVSTSTTWYGLDVVFEPQVRNTLIVNAGKDTAAIWPCDSIKVNGIATGDNVQYVWSVDNQWGNVSVTGTNTLNPVVKFKEPDSGAVLILTATDKWGTTSEHGVSVSVMPDFEPYVKRYGELIMNQIRWEMIRKWKAGE